MATSYADGKPGSPASGRTLKPAVRELIVRSSRSHIVGLARQDFEDWAWLLFDEARILEGGLPVDPAKFSERLNRLLLAAL